MYQDILQPIFFNQENVANKPNLVPGSHQKPLFGPFAFKQIVFSLILHNSKKRVHEG